MEPGDSRLTDTLSMLMAHPEMLRGFASLIGGMGVGGRNGAVSDGGRQPTPDGGGRPVGSVVFPGTEPQGSGDRRSSGDGYFPDPPKLSGEGQPFFGEPPFSDNRSPGDRQPPQDRLSEIIDSVVAQGSAASVGGRETGSANAESGETGGYGGGTAGATDADGASVAAGAFSGGNSGGKRQFRLPGDKRLTLLVALKPYLSPRRAATVDSMVRFGKIGELLEGFLPGNGGK